MHPSVDEWVGAMVSARGLADPAYRVLEVGSFDVNGSVRPHFAGVAEYIGLDIRPGPGVDVVVDEQAYAFQFPRGWIDVVVSTEMLEHCLRPWSEVNKMAAVLRPGGFLLLTTRGFGFGVHDHPRDFWRFSTGAVALLLDDAGLDVEWLSEDTDPLSPGVFAMGVRR